MMNLFICSSSAILRLIQTTVLPVEEDVTFFVKDKMLHFGVPENYLDVESRKDFKATVDHKSFAALIRFLHVISDQPLTLGFDGSRWIYIKEAIL